MSYKIEIRKNDTGEVRFYEIEWDWFKNGPKGDLFWWTEGNFRCDCNREDSWLRAGGPGPPEDPDYNDHDAECGHERYTVIRAILPDGTSIPIDSAPGEP